MSSFRAAVSALVFALALAPTLAPTLAACRGDAAHDRPESTTETWNGITLYPGSRQLCDQHVTAAPTNPPSSGTAPREIEWRSYATSDPPDRVLAHFDPDGNLVETKEDGETTLRRDGVRISIFSLPMSRPAPTCSTRPRDDQKTLIVLHRQTVPAN